MRAIYAFGSNGSGQLGIEHDEDVSSPVKSQISIGEDQDVKKISAGGNHTLILLSNGQIHSTGTNIDGRCFTHEVKEAMPSLEKHIFRQVILNEPFTSASFSLCASTWEASIGVLRDGRLISCGSGRRGELGLGQAISTTTEPQLIRNFPPAGTAVIDLSASLNHVVAVLSNGEVWGWGAGRKGQLAQPAADQWEPRKLSNVSFRATKVACGKEFTYIVGESCSGRHLVLGSDKWVVNSNKPTELPPWIGIGASWGGIYVLLENGEMMSWGRNDHKQLCSAGLPKVKRFAVGSEHVICVTESGEVIAWGWGEHGNCGPLENEIDFDLAASIIPFKLDAVDVGAGCATSWIVTNS